MPIRLLAVDLDGTLLDSQQQISNANRETLIQASARGVQVVVVTGRRFHSAEPLVKQIACPVTLITSNGALIGSASGEVVYRNFLPARLARQVLETGRSYRPYAAAIFDTPSRGQIVMQENAISDGPLGWYLTTAPERLLLVPDLVATISEDPVQVMFGGPPKKIEAIEALLESSPTRGSIHLTWTKYLTRDISLLDVMNKGCSKGTALKLWSERCGIDRRQVMAIGDNYNDLEMLQFAGFPVVMANSCPGLARKDWFVTLPNDQDGVARAIERYILNGER